MTFTVLEVQEEIVKALKEDGIIKPTKIQEIAIPIVKSGKDVVAISNTGSGKTAAFGIPVLEKVVPKAGLQVLILAPTRELAVQISDELKKFSRYIKCSIATVYGGVALDPQTKAIAKADIVVGTTGRLCDHLQRRNLNLTKLKCVVLDEADKMVEMGFIEDIERLLSQTPRNRQILLFGATISNEINHIKRKHMNDPEVAKAALHVKEDLLEQYYYDVRSKEKFSLLVHLLKKEDTQRVMIFCATRANVETLTQNLKAQGVKCEMIHGKLTQNRRLSIIKNFNEGKSKILVASAVAARGLDIRNVSHVFNYGLSNDPQEYVHRVGRTARAGESGKAITLLEPKDHAAFGQILNKYRINVQKLEKEEFPHLDFRINKSQFGRSGPRRFSGSRGGFGGSRGGSGNRGRSQGGFGSRREGGRSDSRPRGRSRGGSDSSRSGSRGSDRSGKGPQRRFGRR